MNRREKEVSLKKKKVLNIVPSSAKQLILNVADIEFQLLWNKEIGVKLYLTIFIFTASYKVGEIIT